jgi:hypothetical protein
MVFEMGSLLNKREWDWEGVFDRKALYNWLFEEGM